jgi:hypothetical protein
MAGMFGMSEDERKKILNQHKDATKDHHVKKQELKKGIQVPKEEKSSK